ncbi:MAG: TraR/DksA family transcriptional regulator [Waddliaceae bacterium]|nr:TraR/DksA family transcriptional regulator [Waddliaceae bacterium]MBT3578742.1 TraR/DksA family transcriptional regulator [Waddliaceae bacterium]MBT4444356.1 TraR/DksA family transcriptional regulator [Waddliaceae bacterium]MBT6928271.1 TraR/DksA family transcriptional regulator [Waddliaceae bacterium]MBT7264957.1 TraR/DksA family transcriptional regulator [Waddliaceae bacterium]
MAISKKRIEKFKKILEDTREQLFKSLKGTTEEVKTPDESSGYSQHQADEGTDDFDKTISLELSSKETVIVKQIDRALSKIEDGTYGKCDITGKAIPLARLEAIPYAVTTVEAQEQREKGLL